MYRTIPYIILCVLTMLLQIYFFDNLSISVYLSPLIYICILLLLPIEMPPILVLLIGLLVGVVMDYSMGVVGINTATTVFIAFLRHRIFRLFLDKNSIRDGGIPSIQRFGSNLFFKYLIISILLHHTLFFLLEDLSLARLPFTLIRIFVSSLFSVLCIWIITQLFLPKLHARL